MNEQNLSTNFHQTRILIVDDHPGTAVTLGRAISQIAPGIEVISATSGETALEKIKDDAVDLVITDMMMPDMNGLELIEKLQTHPGGRPAYTILMTAYDIPGLKESARRLKVNETIIKPFRPERICQIIGNVIEEISNSKTPAQPAVAGQQFKILIADDVPENILLLSRGLKNEGFTLITAANGVEALEKTYSEMPDLILLDVNMPGKDGFEVLKEIRSDRAIEHIPVIILTAARIGSADMQSGLNLGADDYISKPFDRRELIARIRTKLRAKESDEIVRRRNKELSVLPEIGRDFSGRIDMNELAEIVIRRAVETLGAAIGHLFIPNPEELLHKEYHVSTSVFPASKVQLPLWDDLLTQIKDTQQCIIINDLSQNTHWQTLTENPPCSAIIAPILGRLNLVGLMVLIHEDPGYFNSDHQLLLQAIASYAAIALENAQLYLCKIQEK